MNLFQRLRLDCDITYHEIEILVAFVSFPLDIAIRETLTGAIINSLDSFSIQWLRLNRDFDILVALFFIPLDVAIPETPIWSYIYGPDPSLI